MLPFYANIVAKAFLAIPSSLGGNWLGLIWPAVIIGAAELMACLVYGFKTVVSKNRKKFSLLGLQAFGACYLLLFAWCAVKEIYTDDKSLSVRAADLQKSVDTLGEHERISVLMAQNQCAVALGQNTILANQNRDQQNSINGCLSKALDFITPPKLKVETVEFQVVSQGAPTPGPSATLINVVGIVNRAVSPVDVTVTCNDDIAMVKDSSGNPELALLGGKVMIFMDHSTNLTSSKTAHIHIGSPAWTPEHPLWLPLLAKGEGTLCEMTKDE